MNKYCYLNGQIVLEQDAKISAFDEGFLYGYGVYETLRTINQKIINWDEHFQRLSNSLSTINISLSKTNDELKNATEELIKLNQYPESRIRITVSKGLKNNPTILIQTQELILPNTQEYQKGVAAITIKSERSLPEVKSTNLLEQKLIGTQIKTKDLYEAIFVNPTNQILEGLKSNIFIVKDQIIYTPKSNILPGITKKILGKIIATQELKSRASIILLEELYNADEVFITNAIIGVLPLNKVDEKNYTVGPITQKLISAYQEYLIAKYGKK